MNRTTNLLELSLIIGVEMIPRLINATLLDVDRPFGTHRLGSSLLYGNIIANTIIYLLYTCEYECNHNNVSLEQVVIGFKDSSRNLVSK